MLKWLKSISAQSRRRIAYLLLGFFLFEVSLSTARDYDQVCDGLRAEIVGLEAQVVVAESAMLDVERSYRNSLQRIVMNLYEDETYGTGGLEAVTAKNVDDLFVAIVNATGNYRSLLGSVENYFDARREYIVGIPSIWPVMYDNTVSITSGFGLRISPISGELLFHKGIDITGKGRTKIIATAGGTVYSVWLNHRVYGMVVEINHPDAVSTIYAHLSSVWVGEGDVVERGQIIGVMGNTGQSRGMHLHYEVRKSGVSVNPVEYLSSSRTLNMSK